VAVGCVNLTMAAAFNGDFHLFFSETTTPRTSNMYLREQTWTMQWQSGAKRGSESADYYEDEESRLCAPPPNRVTHDLIGFRILSI
jgi:hypothetical protein